jgi:hypothetical protein
VQAAAQHADDHALPFSGMDQGNSLPYWEPTPNPSRLWLSLDPSTPLMFYFGFLGLHLAYSPLVLHAVAPSDNSCSLGHMPEYYL